MHEIQCAAYLMKYNPGKFFRQTTFAFEEGVDLARAAEFLQEVHAFGVPEPAVEFYYVGVVEVVLDFYLSAELDYQLLVELAALDSFQGADETTVTVTGNEDLSELALAQFLAQLEVLDSQVVLLSIQFDFRVGGGG